MGRPKHSEDRPCTKCGKSFPEVKFHYKGGERGLQRRSECTSCRRLYKKQWDTANSHKHKEYSKKHRQAHPDKIREEKRKYNSKRRALLKNLPSEHFTRQDWQELKAYYNHSCLRCGKQEPSDEVVITVDHVIPLSKGGTNDISNIQPLCLSCNSRKGTKDTDYRYYYSA